MRSPARGARVEAGEAVAARLRAARAARGSGRARRRSALTRGSTSTSSSAAAACGPVERLEVRVGDRDHVAAPVAVEPHRADDLARLQVASRPGRRPGRRARGSSEPTRRTRPVGSGPGLRRSGSGSRAAGGAWASRARRGPARRAPSAARPRPGRRRPRAGRGRPSARRGCARRTRRRRRGRRRPRSAAGRRCPSRARARAPPGRRSRSAGLELVAVDARGVDVHPADAEADARRAQPVGERERLGVARRARSTIPLSSMPSTYSSRIASPLGEAESVSCRCASMSSSESTRKIPRWPPESAGFSTAGKPTSATARWRSERMRSAAKRGCGTPASASARRIATLWVMRCAVVGADPRAARAPRRPRRRPARPGRRRP